MFHSFKVFFHCLFCQHFNKCQRKFLPNKMTEIYEFPSDEDGLIFFDYLECIKPIEEEEEY